MKLGIIGCGAIGTDVAKAASKMPEIERIYLYDTNEKAAKKLCDDVEKAEIKKVEDFLDKVDLVLEAASQEAVKVYGRKILDAGKGLIIMTIGALFDDELRKKLVDIAKQKNCKIYLPSGAVCGIDGLRAGNIAGVDHVTLVTTKPPLSLGIDSDKRVIVFEGSAREAVKKFPANINVAACLSLAGKGFDETMVKIVADPIVNRISHKILAHGKFGRLRAEVENLPNPNNPKSSYLASLSVIAMLHRIIEPLQIGI